jgi:hypothetical protein
MVDFSTVHSNFYPKSQKPVKAVIQHLPVSILAEDISDGLVNHGFDVISIKQMSTTHQSPAEGTIPINIILFLITIPRTSKFREIFKFTSLCHIAIRVEAYKAQIGLTELQLPTIRPWLG